VLIGRRSERRIVAHDPGVPVSATGHPTIRGASSALECVRDADVLLIMTPWPQYRSLDPAALARVMRGNIVIDPYAVLDLARCRDAGLAVHRLGEAEATL
jgi:UDPglucose 6-dehydrogenase